MRFRRVSLGSLLVTIVFTLALAAPGVSMAKPSGDGPGNSANARACRNGGWTTVQAAGSGPFTNQGDCVSYAASGGVFIPLNPNATLTLVGHSGPDCIMRLGGTGFPATFTLEAWFSVNGGFPSPHQFTVNPDGSFVYGEGIGLQLGDTLFANVQTLDGTLVAEAAPLSC